MKGRQEIMPQAVMPKYEPLFNISENIAPDIGDLKIGQRLQAIANYQVIEKTKSYTVLRINGFYLLSSRRKF